ncbi:MAG: family 10 glycosylhydrolase [Cyclobacteriaceae bacterium]
MKKILKYALRRFRSLSTLICVVLLFVQQGFAQNPKTEIRGVWVATVSNLDWPTGSNRFDKDHQQATMLALLDSALAWNLNAIILQIRPQSDAFYESTLAPWSEYISGSRGVSPGYDPLLFAIEEAHKRGLELHGWLNPYRYETSVGKNDGKPGDFNAEHPEWMLNYSDDRIFNPGVPEVQQHLKEIVGEIINNYDIDGIHFDDYFYPYSGTGSEDQSTYETYGEGFASIGDWRRNNVNQMIGEVYDTIQSIKPYIRFGISPFGIYGNGQNPSGIVGLDAYNTIYTDPLQWLSEGNIDYLNPQLYWPTGGSQDFASLLPWWAGHAHDNGRHVIAGHGIYRLDSEPATARIAGGDQLHETKSYFDLSNSSARVMADAWTLDQVETQIEIVRDNRDKNAVGGVFFRNNDFTRVSGLIDYLNADVYSAPALMPAMTWKNAASLNAPANIRWEEDESGISYLTWDQVSPDHRYVVYASDDENPADGFFDDPSNLVAVLYQNAFYMQETSSTAGKPYIFITTYDRYGNESANATQFAFEVPSSQSELLSPADDSAGLSSFFDFEWSSTESAQQYRIQISTSSTFSTIDFETSVDATAINATEFDLLGDQTYYWRVAAGNFFGFGPESEVFTFKTGFPGSAQMIYPVADEERVDLSPLIKWESDPLVAGVRLQIAKGGEQFEDFNIVIDEDLGAVSQYQVSQDFVEWTTYHLRIQLYNDLGQGDWFDMRFKTMIRLPEAPVIYSPLIDEPFTEESEINFVWSKTALATGYQVVLSSDSQRQNVLDETAKFSSNDTTSTLGPLSPGVYYLQVAGSNVGGPGEWSQVVLDIAEVLNTQQVDIVSPLKAHYQADGSINVMVITGQAEFEIDMFDISGKRMVMPTPSRDADGDLTYSFKRDQIPGIALITLQMQGGAYQIKVMGND